MAYSLADGIIVCHLPYGPTAYFSLSNVVMRHDIPDVGTMSEAYPHLIFHNFSSRLGERVSLKKGKAQMRKQFFVSHLLNAISKVVLVSSFYVCGF